METEKVRFGVFGDLHLDIMNDGERRFHAFMDEMRGEDVDFIIQLGDFCYPDSTDYCACSEENMPVNLKNSLHFEIDVPKMKLLHEFNSFEKPSYHVLGNHEFDFCSKEKALSVYGMKHRYDSFTVKGWKFLVLDGNNYRDKNGVIRGYEYGDYFDSADLPYIDREQLEWLEAEILGDTMPVVIFSHQPAAGSSRAFRNCEELYRIFDKANEKEKRVRLCMNGHTHLDELICREGIYYYTVNSMSNHWMGEAFGSERYDEETERKYPNLKYVLPYKEPLYALVTLDGEGMEVKGKRGEFTGPGAKAGVSDQMLSPSIKDRKIVWGND